MALNWRTQDALPYLPNYTRAAAHERGVKPIRGNAEGLKPLGRRDQKHHAIWRTSNDEIWIVRGHINPNDTESVKRNWGSVLLIYRPNGDILIGHQPSFVKAAECELLSNLLMVDATSRHNALWVETTNKGSVKLHPLIEDNRFRPDKSGVGLESISARPQVIHRINRAGMKEVRKRYDTFLRYARGMSKLRRDDPPTYAEMLEVIGPNPTNPKAIRWFRMPGQYGWNRRDTEFLTITDAMRSDDPARQLYAWMCFHRVGQPAHVAQYIDRTLIAAHPDEVLDIVECTDGKIHKDIYQWVFVGE